MSAPSWISSLARISSNPGSTKPRSPFNGTTSAKVRSLRPQRTPVKYCMAGPGSITTACSPNSFIASRSFSIRAAKVASPVAVFCGTLFLTERLIDGRTLLAKHPGAVLGDVHAIFQAHSEFAENGDGGFVAEAHPRLHRALVAAHQIRPFVAIQADSVPGAMRESRELVARPESGIGDHLSSGGVHRFAGRSRSCRPKRRVLRLAFQLPDIALA